MTTKVMTTNQAKAALKKLLKAQGMNACPVCKALGGVPVSARMTRPKRTQAGQSPEAFHAESHFPVTGDACHGWWVTAVIEGLTLLPDEWMMNTPADNLRHEHPRPWRFVTENHKAIAAAGIRCEYRTHTIREIGNTRSCVFIDTDFWELIVQAGKGVRGAREYHALLMGIISETGKQVRGEAQEAPEAAPVAPEAAPAPVAAPPAPAPVPVPAPRATEPRTPVFNAGSTPSRGGQMLLVGL